MGIQLSKSISRCNSHFLRRYVTDCSWIFMYKWAVPYTFQTPSPGCATLTPIKIRYTTNQWRAVRYISPLLLRVSGDSWSNPGGKSTGELATMVDVHPGVLTGTIKGACRSALASRVSVGFTELSQRALTAPVSLNNDIKLNISDLGNNAFQQHFRRRNTLKLCAWRN